MATVKIPVNGLSQLAYAVSGGGNSAYQDAFNNEAAFQSKIAQSMAATRKANAEADAEIEAANSRRPEAIRSNAMTGLGIPQDAAPDVENFQNSGYIGKYQLPANTAGPTMDQPEWVGQLGNLGRMIAATQNAVTLGDKNSENVAKSYGVYDNINKQDRIISGDLAASKLGQAVAAAAGKPLVTGHEYGVVDNFTGSVDDANPVAKRFGTYRDAQTGASRASAANSYASADQHRATTDYTRSKIGQGQTTTLPDGTVITTGGTPPKLTELQGKAMLFGSRAAEADAILNDVGDKYSPAAINTKAYAEGVPIVGGGLAAAGNTFLSKNSQKVEQAQRDFINAILRLESGAAIAESEFQNAKKQYFPQPGDSKDVISQKARNRQTAISGLRTMAGPAAGSVQPRQGAARNVTVDY